MYSRPRFGSPTSRPSAPSFSPYIITQVGLAWMPSLCSMDAQNTSLRAPGASIGVDPELRHDEQRNAAHAGRRSIDARQHHVHDVLGQVVLAVGDEDLLAVEPVVRSGGRGAGAHLREIAARLRLGQVHGAGPLAAHHLRQVQLFLLRRTEVLDGFDGALREHRAKLEREVRSGPDLFDRGAEHGRHVLAAEFRLASQRRPAVFAELPVGVLVAFGHGHANRPTS